MDGKPWALEEGSSISFILLCPSGSHSTRTSSSHPGQLGNPIWQEASELGPKKPKESQGSVLDSTRALPIPLTQKSLVFKKKKKALIGMGY